MTRRYLIIIDQFGQFNQPHQLSPHLRQNPNQLLILRAPSQPTQLLPVFGVAVSQDVAAHRERCRQQRRNQEYGPILDLRLGHRNSPFKLVDGDTLLQPSEAVTHSPKKLRIKRRGRRGVGVRSLRPHALR